MSIFSVFAKAFEFVVHEFLVKKLSRYGIRRTALNWFRSNLSDRKQFVSLNVHNSQFYSTKSGVTQGSYLGPILILVLINDFLKCSKFFWFTLFADDSTLTCSFSNMSLGNITNSINQNLETINHWLNVTNIKVNTHTSYHIVSS